MENLKKENKKQQFCELCIEAGAKIRPLAFRKFDALNMFLCSECYLDLLNCPMEDVIGQCEICNKQIINIFFIKDNYLCCIECKNS